MRAKHLLHLSVVFVCLSLIVSVPQRGAKAHALPEIEKSLHTGNQSTGTSHETAPVDLPKGTPSDWWSKVQKDIRDSEYHVKWQEKPLLENIEATWQASNRAQNLRTYFIADGFHMIPRSSTSTAPEWCWGLSLQGYGYREDVRDVDQATLVPSKNRMEYRRGALTEWYVNDRRGLEQGFTLREPPSGHKGIDTDRWVALRMSIYGNLRGAIDSNKNNIEFITPKGVSAVQYGHLKVFDAAGKDLPARLVLNGNSMDILVDTSNADYPLTVDPLASSPNWTAESNQENAGFGRSLSDAGDVNGDGFEDIIVGAEGLASVYYGSPSGLSPTAEWMNEYGWVKAVSSAGDVNGDGFDDIIVGTGALASVYYGSSTGLSPTAEWMHEHESLDDVSTAGDVNGDGFDDIIVGGGGRASVYYGSPTGLSQTAAWTEETPNSPVPYIKCPFGASVSTAGDVNGDGFDDVIVSDRNVFVDPRDPDCPSRVYVYHGSSTGLRTTANWTGATDIEMEIYVTPDVSTAGDVNGDGFDDVIFKEPGTGRIFAYYGSSTGLNSPADWSVEYSYKKLVSTAGDVNGDGFDDVLVGEMSGLVNWPDRASVYYGLPTGLSPTAAWVVRPYQEDDWSGANVSAAGDVNGDGFDDVIVGAPGYDNGQVNEGRAYVYHGNSDPDNDYDRLHDALEEVICTNPSDADSDDDGIIDGIEDANQNGIVDTGETNPCLVDTDGDGIQDGTESGLTVSDVGSDTNQNTFVADADPTTTTNPTMADTDRDGISDGDEDLNHNGRVDAGEGDPNPKKGNAMPWVPLLLQNE